ncbi:hypothetical protein V8E54_004108 [Elaphomyces granulatus]
MERQTLDAGMEVPLGPRAFRSGPQMRQTVLEHLLRSSQVQPGFRTPMNCKSPLDASFIPKILISGTSSNSLPRPQHFAPLKTFCIFAFSQQHLQKKHNAETTLKGRSKSREGKDMDSLRRTKILRSMLRSSQVEQKIAALMGRRAFWTLGPN